MGNYWEKNEFRRKSFDETKTFFQQSLNQLEREPEISVKSVFRTPDDTSFEAVVYVNGQEQSKCGVWLDDRFSRSCEIGFSDNGIGDKNGFNEQLSIEENGYELYLRPLMRMAHLHVFDVKEQQTSSEAADYLWRIFSEPLYH